MAERMIEIFSIAIFPKSLPCEVYGSISLFDENDSEQIYQLYERDSGHPEVISESGQILLLKGPDIALRMPKYVMSIHLKNKTQHNAIIASGSVVLDNTTSNDYEEFKYSIVKGECGQVRVNYIALACAIMAEIYVDLCDFRHGSDDSGCAAFGTIVARYGKTYGSTTRDISGEYLSSMLFKVPSNESIPIVFDGKNNTSLQLRRKLVAVPAYSSLIIEADIKEKFTNKAFFKGTFEKMAYHKNTSSSVHYDMDRFRIDVVDGKSILSVRWREPFELRETEEEALALLKLDNILEATPLEFTFGETILEVFSVFIGRVNDDDLCVSGTIRVIHNGGSLVIFKRDDDNSDRLVNGSKLLSITGPSSPSKFMCSHSFSHILMDLEDANFNDRLLIKEGAIDFITNKLPNDEIEMDRLLCRVIQGKSGYCAVHYAIFHWALRIEIKSYLLCNKGGDVAKVHGRIVVWSDMFDYTSDYDKKYYRRVLFDKSEDNAHCLRIGHKQVVERGLSRSYVALPIGCSLYVEFDLYFSSHLERGPTEHLHDTLQFRPGGNSPLTISGGDFDLLFVFTLLPMP